MRRPRWQRKPWRPRAPWVMRTRLAHAVTHGAIFAVVCRDVESALSLSTETIEFANKHEMELWNGYGLILHGFAQALRGELREAVRFTEEGPRFNCPHGDRRHGTPPSCDAFPYSGRARPVR